MVKKLEYWARNEPHKKALQMKYPDGYESLTYSELWERCNSMAEELKSSGFNPGDHISIYGENSHLWAVTYLSIHLMGGVVVPLDAQLSPKDLFNIISFSDAKAIIADESHLLELEKFFSDSGNEIKLVSLEALCRIPQSKDEFKPYIPSPDDLQTIVFTSGTTGEPKGVMLTFGNVLNNVQSLIRFTKVSTRDNVLNILPLNHGYSCIIGFLSPLWAGATVTFSQSIKSTDLLDAMRETGVTVFPAVPKLFTLLDREIFKKVDSLPFASKLIFRALYSISKWVRLVTRLRTGALFFSQIHKPFGGKLRFFASGGAKLDPVVGDHFLNLGFLMVEGYGLTETSAVSTLNPLGNPKPGKGGIPIGGVKVRIDSPDPDGIGEICIQGHNVMRGYYKNEDATREVLRDGWLHTGDLGKIDSDGSVVITGREKEVIVLSSGKNIYPEEVEKLYEKIPLVKELCVQPSLDSSGFVRGLQMVVVPDAEELKVRGVFNPRERIRSEITMRGASLPSFMQITELVLFYNELPRTLLGKIKRKELENLLKMAEAATEEQELIISDEEKELMELPTSARFLARLQDIAKITGPFSPSQDLSIDLGVDSLTLVQITVLLENEFGLVLKEEELPSVRTIGDILNRLKEVSITSDEVEQGFSIEQLLKDPPSLPLDTMFNLRRSALKRIMMRIFQIFVLLFLKAAFRASIKGADKIPQKRSFLICPNHQSYIDPVLIFALIPGRLLNRLLFTGFGELFDKAPLSWLVRPLRLIRIGTTETFGESLKLSYDGLNRGMSLVIFPEGRRTPTGYVMQPRIGAGILSVEARVPIVPILIEGATSTLSPIHPELRFPKVSVIVGDPIEPQISGDHPRDNYQSIVDQWKDAVLALENEFNLANEKKEE
ncbi:AMP-binding protein [Desulfobacterota bacterium AH_259_B03_O07]|nr:AMP-binding protein [Desulfobacterota bacterium AH_259_B03_O07]